MGTSGAMQARVCSRTERVASVYSRIERVARVCRRAEREASVYSRAERVAWGRTRLR